MKKLVLRKSKLTPKEIETLYLVGLKTMQEIADKAGVSRASICQTLDRLGIQYRGGALDRVCAFCGGGFKAPRTQVKKERGNYCSPSCFGSARSMGGDMSVHSRVGRGALAAEGVKLEKGQVVHHIDGDRTNNNPKNLRVFPSQREHMRFHHSLRIDPTGGAYKPEE